MSGSRFRTVLAAGLLVTAALLIALSTGPATSAAEPPDFTAGELRRVLQHGPWPGPAARDPSNRASGDSAAIALGRRLFFDGRLSVGGAVSCASCHDPARAWTDGRARAQGLSALDRNTPTVLNAAQHRWFSWDGRADSLWAQSVQPILDPREERMLIKEPVIDRHIEALAIAREQSIQTRCTTHR